MVIIILAGQVIKKVHVTEDQGRIEYCALCVHMNVLSFGTFLRQENNEIVQLNEINTIEMSNNMNSEIF